MRGIGEWLDQDRVPRFRRPPDGAGGKIPRHIINRFTATFNGQPVIDVTLEPAASANPYLSFYMRAEMSGEFLFTWFDDDGSIYTTTAAMTVT